MLKSACAENKKNYLHQRSGGLTPAHISPPPTRVRALHHLQQVTSPPHNTHNSLKSLVGSIRSYSEPVTHRCSGALSLTRPRCLSICHYEHIYSKLSVSEPKHFQCDSFSFSCEDTKSFFYPDFAFIKEKLKAFFFSYCH